MNSSPLKPRQEAGARLSKQPLAVQAATSQVQKARHSGKEPRSALDKEVSGVTSPPQSAQAGHPGGETIKVILRVRPLNARERNLNSSGCVLPTGPTTLCVRTAGEAPHNFAFDVVADEFASQEQIYRAAGRHVVNNFLAGVNGCIFAYGQTGSGKTHTILGSTDGELGGGGRGLTQRVFEHVFTGMREEQRQLEAMGGSCRHVMQCSMLEIYEEKVSDLLRPASNLPVREDVRKGVFVAGLSTEEVHSVEDVLAALQRGIASRRVAETKMNDHSSRSHCVFSATLQTKIVDSSGANKVRTSRLHMVDLAGSERQKDTGVQGKHLREAININSSLSALGRVITSLAARQRHVPFRDSKLTHLLQDSLGGNSKTVLVANISPATIHYAETLSTLRFADKAKKIKTKAVVNEDVVGGSAAALMEIKRLQGQLTLARQEGEAAKAMAQQMEEQVGHLQSQVEQLEGDVDSLRWQMATWRQAAEIESELGAARVERNVAALRASHEQLLHLQADMTADGVLLLLARIQELHRGKSAAECDRNALRLELASVRRELELEQLGHEEALEQLDHLSEYTYAVEQAKEAAEQELMCAWEALAQQADEREAALLVAADATPRGHSGSLLDDGGGPAPGRPAGEVGGADCVGTCLAPAAMDPFCLEKDAQACSEKGAKGEMPDKLVSLTAAPATPALREAPGRERSAGRLHRQQTRAA